MKTRLNDKYLLQLLHQPTLVTRLVRCPLTDAEELLQKMDPIERLEVQRTERETTDGPKIFFSVLVLYSTVFLAATR